MNKILFFATTLIAGAMTLVSCDDDLSSNPVLETPTSFTLNEPTVQNGTIDLKKSTGIDLVWSQPKFTDLNAPMAATYAVQLSTTGTFNKAYDIALDDNTGADYYAFDNTYQGTTATLDAETFNKALMYLNQWTEEAVPATQEVYLRMKATLLDASNTEHNSVLSNVVKLNTIPYYYELSDADPIMWYILGNNFGDGSWGTDNAGIGSKCFPFFFQSDYSYDKKTGAGEIVYMNYFTTDGFKINPSTLSDWDHGFMSGGEANTATYRNGGDDNGNIWMDPAGYYKITINTASNECTITKQEITPTVYTTICISGDNNGWTDTEMTPVNKEGENHVWCYELTVPAGATYGEKFKIAGSWDTNWGGATVGNGTSYLCGVGTQNGDNISIGEGTWIIMFNDIDGTFSIIAKQQ